MATRMQQRRGTALQWTSTNNGDGPILNAGEIGFESDTGKFKIGDGVNHWIDLDYFLDESDIDSIRRLCIIFYTWSGKRSSHFRWLRKAYSLSGPKH